MGTVKICPVCDSVNAESAMDCAICTSSLSDVDPSDRDEGSPRDVESATPAQRPESVPGVAPETPDVGLSSATASSLRTDPGFVLEFSDWDGAPVPVGDHLMIGRVRPAPMHLCDFLEQRYLNVSRVHAELFVRDEQLFVRDIGSLNGTYLDMEAERLEAFREYNLVQGDVLRFGAGVRAEIRFVATGGEQS